MRTDIVLTLTGPDRVGIVEDVTAALLELDGNVGGSRMVRLGGTFAILMEVSLPAEGLAKVDATFGALTSQGYTVTTRTEEPDDARYDAWIPYTIEVSGADHEGIVHEIAHGLSQRGITIESAETWTETASVSGAPLFSMTAEVLVPPALEGTDWQSELAEAGDVANVDVVVIAVG